jgi:ERCC4-type nuclease
MSLKNYTAGDFITTGKLIERKTTGDFMSSVMDKRIWEQMTAFRMYAEDETYKYEPILLIEGDWHWTLKRYPNGRKIRNGVLNSIALEYRIPVVYTVSMNDTINKLAQWATGEVKSTIAAVRNKGLKGKPARYVARFIAEGIPGYGPVKALKALIEAGSLRDLLRWIVIDKETKTYTKTLRKKMNPILDYKFKGD